MIIEKELKISKPLPECKRALLNLLFTGNWITDEITSVLKPFDITTQQFNVLRILKGKQGEPCSLQTIQERMINKMSNTTRLVDKLIRKNYVEREQCESNRRKVDITITEEGINMLDLINTAVDEAEMKMTDRLSPADLKELNRLLHKLRTEHYE
ncbi:MarR family winged helix-turn-helix transcriptional regulator [Psychroflexus sediminis]|uniref:DNA-binding transcriptional regulator, MarR family n=1 Tax=Psychroflexus sediminis TaxID=470826 RepID=A0A1G7XF08_9FLAO|nr:MarR family transcriptional regulator [Psychroflexus sediminis]SDG82779.1 DNA-binding transcriptional regulator, MarR family [Psychroflexus sediminis]